MLKDFFMWCSIINIVLLTVSFLMILAARNWIYKLHGRWFKLSPQQFDYLLYCILGFYKMGMFLFCIVPYIALLIIT